MYARVLDEQQVARDTIDAIRSTTDAPLYLCIEAAKNIMEVIAPFIQDESFERIRDAVEGYTLCVNDCYDYRFLTNIKEQLARIFSEKNEHSYSCDQDVILVKYIHMFSDCVNKTDPTIVKHVTSRDDYQWLNDLINVYQMDQNEAVRWAGLNCIWTLTCTCPELIPFFLNSRLPEILAMEFHTPNPKLSEAHVLAIKFLIKIYSTEESPPLHHFDLFDVTFFTKLVEHVNSHPAEVMDFITNFNFFFTETMENQVIDALEIKPCPVVGQLLIKSINEKINDRGLKFFTDIAKRHLCGQFFYENDLDVLSHVVARELVNSESEVIRNRCLECIARLEEMGHCDRMVVEAVDSSYCMDAVRSES